MSVHTPDPAYRDMFTGARMSATRTALLGALLVALGPMGLALYTPGMPEIVRALGTTEAAVKLTLSLYFAGFALGQLVAGPLSDAFGRKRTVAVFVAVFLVASLTAMAADGITHLLAARILQGFGASVGLAVSRAVVRDLFEGDASSRIMSTMAIILGIAPALAPTLGGITLELAGWRALFVVMTGFGVLLLVLVQTTMVETIRPDPRRFRPRALVASYRELLGDVRFVAASLVLGGSLGAIYTQATVLPFILIGEVGLSPARFGLVMIMQSGFFLLGSVLTRVLMTRLPAPRLIAPGIAVMLVASVGIAAQPFGVGPGVLETMLPVGLYAIGIALLLPAMSTIVLAPFPHIAGAASAMSGFFQMGSGLVGGLAVAALGDPVIGLAVVVPAMAVIAAISFAILRRAERQVVLTP